MSEMMIIVFLFFILRQLSKIVNKHNLVDRSINKVEGSTTKCNRCGESVGLGSKYFTRRLRDKENFEAKKSKGIKFPEGEFICYDCLEKESKRLEQ